MPREVLHEARRVLFGIPVCFTYDSEGNVVSMTLDDRRPYFRQNFLSFEYGTLIEP